MRFEYAIIVTGGIGSGKSTTCNLLRLYGYAVIDADKISHSQLESSQKEVLENFGNKILTDNKIDRKKLSKIVFQNKAELRFLEKILHPKIKQEIINQAQRLEKSKTIYFIEMPIFFEMREVFRDCEFKKTLLIYAPKELQIKRIIDRNNYSYKEALQRVESQINIEEKAKLATNTIANTGDLKALQNNLKIFLDSLNA